MIWYDIAHDAVGSLSGWFTNRTSSLLVPTATPLSMSCTKSFNTVRALRCFLKGFRSSSGSEVRVKEFGVVEEVPRPLWQTMLVDAEGSSNFDLLYLVYQYLFSQASSLRLRIVRSSSFDVVELSQRVLNFDESGLWTDNLPFEESCLYCGFATDYLQS